MCTDARPRSRGSRNSLAYWLAPVDARSMVAVRVLFGLIMAAGVIRFWAKGWISLQFTQPQIFFPYWGFAWVPVPPPWGIHALFVAMGVSAVFVAAGRCYAAATVTFWLSFTWVELIDQSNYLNHYYLVSIVGFLLCLMPLSGHPRTVPRWTVIALRLQLGLVYTFAGLAKLNADWLLHAQPLRLWLEPFADVPAIGPLLADDVTARVMSWTGMLFDISAFALLSIRRTRTFAYAAVVCFHVITWMLFPIGIFPWLMIALGTVFFAPDWPSRWWQTSPAARTQPASVPAMTQRALLSVVGLHLLVQLLVPLRHLLYPGNDHWHMQAFRFSWKVMLVEKTGMVEFRVVHPPTGRRWVVAPTELLTPNQVRMVAIQPDMLLRFAQILAQRSAAHGVPGVEVYADAWASLNGRRSRRLVDPSVDLAAQDDGLAPKAWITAAPPD